MAEQISLSKNLETFEEDSKWFYENMNSLRKMNLSGKFVAIKDKKIIAEGDNLQTVVRSVEKKGENPAFVLIEFIYPEGVVILL